MAIFAAVSVAQYWFVHIKGGVLKVLAKTNSKPNRQMGGSLRTASVVLLVALFGLLAFGGGAAQAKTLNGELQCAPGEKVSGIWLLGSRSGWHGFDYPSNKRPYTGWYSISNAVQGETMKTWIRCSVFGEFYSSFTVGSGSTRHICSKGWGPCLSTGIGGCAIQVAFTGLNLRTIGCFIRYGH